MQGTVDSFSLKHQCNGASHVLLRHQHVTQLLHSQYINMFMCFRVMFSFKETSLLLTCSRAQEEIRAKNRRKKVVEASRGFQIEKLSIIDSRMPSSIKNTIHRGQHKVLAS